MNRDKLEALFIRGGLTGSVRAGGPLEGVLAREVVLRGNYCSAGSGVPEVLQEPLSMQLYDRLVQGRLWMELDIPEITEGTKEEFRRNKRNLLRPLWCLLAGTIPAK